MVSFGVECPSYGVYARVTKVKQWIQFIADGAMDSNCNQEVAYQPGAYVFIQIGLVTGAILIFNRYTYFWQFAYLYLLSM